MMKESLTLIHVHHKVGHIMHKLSEAEVLHHLFTWFWF